MTYLINMENTGLNNDEQAQRMADLMRADGHDVEFTHNWGAVQRLDENGDPFTRPVSDDEWNRYLVLASADA